MRAVGFYKYLPIDHPESLLDLDILRPTPGPRDLLVRVKAVSVNPVDIKQRAPKEQVEKEPRILGWDAAGIVEQVGNEVSLFRTGEEVWYAGSLSRAGCDSEFHIVDERIVGRKPQSLSFVQAAALPLTSLTAWESLFDRCNIAPEISDKNRKRSILIIGGAGGVGSIATQLAKKVAGLTTIATASRPETVSWCKLMGADHVINHRNPLKEELKKLSIEAVDYIQCCNSIELYIPQLADIIRPQGKICSIIRMSQDQPLQINALMYKSVGFEWELMFTRPMFQTEDMQSQHDILNHVSDLVEKGTIQTTLREEFGTLNAENLRKAHARIESGEMIGKLVLPV